MADRAQILRIEFPKASSPSPLKSPPSESPAEGTGAPSESSTVPTINQRRGPLLPEESSGCLCLAFIFEGGVIVGVGHHRKLFDGSVPNVVELNSHMLATISGGREYFLTDLREKCCKHEHAEGRRTSVAEASQWLSDTLSSCSEEGLSIGVLIAGWEKTGPILYHVDGEGKQLDCKKIRDCTGKEHKCAIVATGTGAIAAQCGLGLGAHYNLSVDEAIFLGKHVVCAASWVISNNILEEEGDDADVAAVCGDVVSVYLIGSDGVKMCICADDMEDHQKNNIPGYKCEEPEEENQPELGESSEDELKYDREDTLEDELGEESEDELKYDWETTLEDDMEDESEHSSEDSCED